MNRYYIRGHRQGRPGHKSQPDRKALPLKFSKGDLVKFVNDYYHKGTYEIVKVNKIYGPTERPYVLKIGESEYSHFEDELELVFGLNLDEV